MSGDGYLEVTVKFRGKKYAWSLLATATADQIKDGLVEVLELGPDEPVTLMLPWPLREGETITVLDGPDQGS